MKDEDRFDLVIVDMIEKHFPELLQDLTGFGWLWVKAQIWQESRFNPLAESPAGARGLMQLMPGTDMEIDGDIDAFDVVGNIENGVKYLADQYRHLTEIPDYRERLLFALACYNGGRGYVNKALELAREAEGLQLKFSDWRQAGSLPGHWQIFGVGGQLLADPRCLCGGKHPDHVQMLDYAALIESRYIHYIGRAAIANQGES